MYFLPRGRGLLVCKLLLHHHLQIEDPQKVLAKTHKGGRHSVYLPGFYHPFQHSQLPGHPASNLPAHSYAWLPSLREKAALDCLSVALRATDLNGVVSWKYNTGTQTHCSEEGVLLALEGST